MSFLFLFAGFLAATNPGRVALAWQAAGARVRGLVTAVIAGAILVVVAVLVANDLLDALDISPESFRIAAGIVLAITAIRTLVWPERVAGPLPAVLVTPEVAVLALSFGADEPTGRVLAAAALSIPAIAVAATMRRREPAVYATQLLAALQIVVAVALVVSGIRDV